MLIEFRFKNYRSFRDEAILSMEAVGLASFKNCLIEHGNMKILPGVAIYGKNGGGPVSPKKRGRLFHKWRKLNHGRL